MYIYNVTINIEDAVHIEWLQWMQQEHIPEVMGTGKFTHCRICRVLSNDESGATYAIQYTCNTIDDYHDYQERFAPELQQKTRIKFKDQYVAVRTLLEVVE